MFAQLGYPNDAATIAGWLAHATPARQKFIAEIEERTRGFVAVEMRDELADCEGAEILALVVDQHARGNGVGASLLRAAEAWARERGAHRIRVRSNVMRKDAHRFYERESYAPVKDQRVFDKRI